MSKCYKTGGCNAKEKNCNKCVASQPEYMLKEQNINIYVATLQGNIKDNYMAIGFSPEAAIKNVLFAFFKDTNHSEADLVEHGVYVVIVSFEKGITNIVY